MFKKWLICSGLLLSSGSLTALGAEIKVGMSAVFTGPAEALGNGMKNGVEAYFNHVNKSGGVNGAQIKFISKDDGYEPAKTGPNMRDLIEKDQVIGVIGNVGTPTAIVAVPIANELKTVLFGAFTGAGVLRKNPPERYIINYRASYAEETAEMVDGFVKQMGIKPEKIAFFTQNDGYGDAGYAGGIAALEKAGYADAKKLAHGRYERNTVNVEDAILAIMDKKPEAIIMVGAYKPCAAFIKLAKEAGLTKTWFANVSFVGSEALLKELGTNAERVLVTQVVPPPSAKEYPVVEEFLKIVEPAKQGFISLEGFIAAKAFVMGLKNAGPNPTKEGLVDSFEKMTNVDLGLKATHSISKTDHQFSHSVWPTRINAGKYELFSWKDLK